LQQATVLRGPQGTLFGRNTSTGAVVLESRAPTFEPEAYAEVGAGNFGLVRAVGYVSGPLSDAWAGRISAWSTTSNGFVDATVRGGHLGSRGGQGVRAQLLYRPSETLRYRFIYAYDRQRFTSVPTTITGLTASRAGALTMYQRFDLAEPGYRPPRNPYAYTSDTDAYSNNVGHKHSATGIGDWTFGDGYTLTSISNFTAWRFWPYNDNDNSKLDGTQQLGGPEKSRQYSQEIRLASPDRGSINWVAGAIYYHSRIAWDFGTRYGADAGYFSPQLSAANLARLNAANRDYNTLASAIGGALNQYATNTAAAPTTDSGAVFGQATWKIAPRLSLSLGLRASYDHKQEDAIQGNSVSGFSGGSLATPGAGLTQADWLARYGGLFTSQANALTVLTASRGTPTASLHASVSDWNGAGTASASYKVTDDILLYSSFSRGFKSAGLNTTIQPAGIPQVVKSETVYDYEAGFKSTLFNKRLGLNVNLFWEDYRNYQANITGSNAVTGAFTQFLGNIKKIVARGVEADVSAEPIDNLHIDASGSYNDTHYGSFDNAPCSLEASLAGQTTCSLTGRPLPYASEWIFNVNAAYDYKLANDATLYAVGNYSYRSGAYISSEFTNSIYNYQTGYGLTDLRAGVRLRGGWDLSVYTQNVFNVHYGTAKAVSTALYFASLTAGAPRTYGLTARVKL
jgi:iron complex outermembrane receptor protein